MNPWLIVGIIILLVMCSAFFSSTETAYSSASKIRLKNYADNGNKKAIACGGPVPKSENKVLFLNFNEALAA